MPSHLGPSIQDVCDWLDRRESWTGEVECAVCGAVHMPGECEDDQSPTPLRPRRRVAEIRPQPTPPHWKPKPKGANAMSIAQDIVSGDICAQCQIPFVESHGYPVVCQDCWDESAPDEQRDMKRNGYSRAVFAAND